MNALLGRRQLCPAIEVRRHPRPEGKPEQQKDEGKGGREAGRVARTSIGGRVRGV